MNDTKEKLINGVKRKNNKWFWIVVILVVIIFIGWRFFSQVKSKKNGDVEVETEAVAYVETITLGEESLQVAKLEKTAIFRSSETSSVVSENTGRIKKVDFEIGDLVKKGQILAVFDQTSSQSTAVTALNSARLNLQISKDNQEQTEKVAKESLELVKNARKIAKMQYENAKDDETEDEDIAKRVYENAKDLEEQTEYNVEIQNNQAQLQLNGAQTAFDGARVAFEKTIIKAPISGRIVSKNIMNNDYLSSGSRIASIVGDGVLETTVSLNADQITRVNVGDKVEVLIDKKSYDAKIVSLSSIAKIANQRFDIKIQLEENLSINANKIGKITLNLLLSEGNTENVSSNFFVPISSVNLGQTKSVVFIMKEGKAFVREVEIGEIIGGKLEIVSGVETGEQLIITNSRNLQDGQLVTTQKETNEGGI